MGLIRRCSKLVFAASDVLFSRPVGPKILIYHQVDAGLNRQMEVKSRDFKRQLDWLARNMDVVHLETALDRWEEEGSDRLAVLTFDDGYRDTFTKAYPMLRDHGFPFTLYLNTEPMETGRPLGPSPQTDPLRWSDIREMLGSGLLTVGSHTHSHKDLRRASTDEIEYELTVNDAVITERLGVIPRHFAYPWGNWSAQAHPSVQKRYASAVLGGSPRPNVDWSAHRIHRYPVQLDDGFAFFKARIKRGLVLEELVRQGLSGRGEDREVPVGSKSVSGYE